MCQKKEKVARNTGGGFSAKPRRTRPGGKTLGCLAVLLLVISGGLYAQTENDFPAGNFWSLDGGLGWSGFLEKGQSFQLIVDPKLWLSPALMVGVRAGMSFSWENGAPLPDPSVTSNALFFDAQAYIRWNFLRLGKNVNRKFNIFAQGGVGLTAVYRGKDQPFDNPQATRGSLMADGALGVTIPLTDRWHIEPSVHGGYPHMFGVSLTAGYKFHLPEKTEVVTEVKTEYVQGETQIEYRDRIVQAEPVIEYRDRIVQAEPQIEYRDRIVYREVLKTVPPVEIIKTLTISSVEFILFGPDIGSYNLGIDQDGQALNDLVLNETVTFLKEHPDYIVRLEGHANPVTTDPGEANELMALSSKRANTVRVELRNRGVSERQIVLKAFGGTRTVTREQARWEMNRRVELIIMNAGSETEQTGD